jgi:hypothetical protein
MDVFASKFEDTKWVIKSRSLDDIQDNDTMKNNKKTNTGREKTTD